MRAVIFFLSVLSSVSLSAQKEKVQAFLDSVVLIDNVPGISVAVTKNQDMIGSFQSGYANLNEKHKVDGFTGFRIASVTKIFTAVAIMKLAEEGKIDLNAPIQNYLPNFPRQKKGDIKVIHLLRHTSGISHYKGNENRSFKVYQSQLEACQIFKDRKIKFRPGSKYQYTSYGYTVLGAIIESVSGKKYGQAIKELILNPCNMNQTALDNRNTVNENWAELYRLEENIIVEDVKNDLSAIYAGGGYVSTPDDMLKFVSAYEKEALVSNKTKKRMILPPIYKNKVIEEHGAIGWNIWRHDTYGQVYHRIGGQSGASALLIVYPEIQVAIAITANRPGLQSIWKINDYLLDWALSFN